MPTANVLTKDNQDSVFLTVDAHGNRSETVIFINNHQIDIRGKDLNHFFLGTNVGLKGNTVTIITHVLRVPAELTHSKVSFTIDGVKKVIQGNPIHSDEAFPDGAPSVPHVMTYIF